LGALFAPFFPDTRVPCAFASLPISWREIGRPARLLPLHNQRKFPNRMNYSRNVSPLFPLHERGNQMFPFPFTAFVLAGMWFFLSPLPSQKCQLLGSVSGAYFFQCRQNRSFHFDWGRGASLPFSFLDRVLRDLIGTGFFFFFPFGTPFALALFSFFFCDVDFFCLRQHSPSRVCPFLFFPLPFSQHFSELVGEKGALRQRFFFFFFFCRRTLLFSRFKMDE